MKAIIDTSSLIALAKYYLPFDKSGALKAIIQSQYESGELMVIDKVADEGKFVAKKIIRNNFDFIYDQPKILVDTTGILPVKTFYNRLENDFCDKQVVSARGLGDAEFESEKARYLETADAKIILYAMKIKAESPVVITEETVAQNDNKVFKKIPTICGLINTDCCTMPIFLKEHCKLNLAEVFN